MYSCTPKISEVDGTRLFQCLKNVIKDPGSWQLSILPASVCQLDPSVCPLTDTHKVGITVKALSINTITSG